jgi:hypothetical protein
MCSARDFSVHNMAMIFLITLHVLRVLHYAYEYGIIKVSCERKKLGRRKASTYVSLMLAEAYYKL